MSNKLFPFGFSSDKKDDSGSNNRRKGTEKSMKLYEQTKRKGVVCSKWKDEFEWLEYEGEKTVMYCNIAYEPFPTYNKSEAEKLSINESIIIEKN